MFTDDVVTKLGHLRFRNVFIAIGTLFVLAALFATDVQGGIQTAMMLAGVASGIIALAFAHLGRKALMDYPEADMRSLFRIIVNCMPTDNPGKPIGAGLALIAIAIIVWALAGLFGPRAHAAPFNVRTDIPPQAMQYLPAVKAAIDRDWKTHPMRGMVPATFEHESGCPTLKKMCWNMLAQLKTQREEGATFIQITRAYRKDGSTRFDALQEMVDKYPQLKGWNWGNVYQRADYAVNAGILKLRENFMLHARTTKDAIVAVLFADLGYNAGNGRVSSDRRACKLKPGCDPQQYWGHVEHTCTASRQPIYGTRSACDISRHHVKDVWARAPKYQRFMT